METFGTLLNYAPAICNYLCLLNEEQRLSITVEATFITALLFVVKYM